MKSASVPFRGRVQKPSNYHRRSIGIESMGLPEQMQRRTYSSASSVLQRGGGVVKIFCWEGEPQQKFKSTTTTALRMLSVIRIEQNTSLRRPPFLLRIRTSTAHIR